MTNRLAPIEPPFEPPFEPDIEAMLARYPRQDGYLLSLFRTFANSKRFLSRGVPNLLDKESPLARRDREIVILQVTAHYDCEYEWGVHVAIFARAAKLTPEQVAATRLLVTNAPVWSERGVRLISAVDGFCHRGVLSDDELDTFTEDWSKAQQLEIIALCGTYHTISLVANAARLAPEPFAVRFPAG